MPLHSSANEIVLFKHCVLRTFCPCTLSPYYFSKIFKEETGENFIEYLTKIRIEKAKELLVKPDISIKEAGIRSGYTDPNYFSRIFKKQTDMTPSEYKTRYGE